MNININNCNSFFHSVSVIKPILVVLLKCLLIDSKTPWCCNSIIGQLKSNKIFSSSGAVLMYGCANN